MSSPSDHEQNSDPFQLEDSDTETESSSSDVTEGASGLLAPPPPSVPAAEARSPLAQDVPLGSPQPTLKVAQISERTLLDESRLQLPLPAAPQEETMPELYLPGLVNPSLFFPIPNVRRAPEVAKISYIGLQTDQLSTLLHKYIAPELRPYRDLTGEWQQSDPHSLAVGVLSRSSGPFIHLFTADVK